MLAIDLIGIGFGVLLIGLSIPLARRRVPPNDLYGLRVPATYADEEIWYDANARSGREGIVAGAIIAMGGFLVRMLLPDRSEDVHALVDIGVLLLVVGVWAIRSWQHANHLWDAKKAGAPPPDEDRGSPT